MASAQPTERWSDRSVTPKASAVRGFDVPGYATAPLAIAACINNFGIRDGSTHPDDNTMYLLMGGVTARNNQGPTTWIVTANYGYLAQGTGGLVIGDPLSNPTSWEIVPGIESIVLERDIYGNPIINSAGQPFDPSNRTINTLEIIATRYYPNFSIATALQYMNKINLGAIPVKSLGTVPAGSMKCTLIAPVGKIILSNPQPIQVVMKFEVRGQIVSADPNDPSFSLHHVDKGRSGWWNDSGTIRQADFTDRQTSSGPYQVRSVETLLNGQGAPLDPNIKVTINNPGITPSINPTPLNQNQIKITRNQQNTAVHLFYTVEHSIDFGPLIAGL